MGINLCLDRSLVALLRQLQKRVPEGELTGRYSLPVRSPIQGIQGLTVQLLKPLRHLIQQNFPVHDNLLTRKTSTTCQEYLTHVQDASK